MRGRLSEKRLRPGTKSSSAMSRARERVSEGGGRSWRTQKRTLVVLLRTQFPRAIPPQMEPIPEDPLSGPSTTPEPRRMVVARAAEQVTERVERKGPHVGFVRELELVLEGEIGHRPVDDGAFRAARNEDVVMDWVPGDCCWRVGGQRAKDARGEGGRTADFLLVPSERDEFLHRANVEDLDELIPRSGRDEVSRRAPGARLNSILVTVPASPRGQLGFARMEKRRNAQRRENFRGTRIPELDEVVLGARDEESFRRMPLDALDVPSVPYPRESTSAPSLASRSTKPTHP